MASTNVTLKSTINIVDNTSLSEFNAANKNSNDPEQSLKFLQIAIDSHEIKDWPRCKLCNKLSIYPNTKIRKTRSFTLLANGSEHATKNINRITYNNTICYSCLVPKLSARTLRKSNWFNAFGEAVRIAFEIPDEVLSEVNKSRAITVKTMTAKYGEEEGLKRYEDYCKKQGDKNKFDYKQKHKGWTKEQFDEFNLSRSSTKENFVKRHGKEKGLKMWIDYCKIQSETSTNEYYLEHKAERFDFISEARSKSRSWCIEKYGEEHGNRIYDEVYQNRGVSQQSVKFFRRIMQEIHHIHNDVIAIFGNEEKSIKSKNIASTKKFDFCIEEIKFLIEYHGTLWHAKPEKYENKIYRHPLDPLKTKHQVWAADEVKAKLAKDAGYEILIVWSDEKETMMPIAINRIIELIKEKRQHQ